LNKITIAIPALNAASTIGMTLESLRPLREIAEIFVVDSHSTDDTVAIAESHGVPVLQVDPGNMYRAVNCGIEAGQSEWVTYINADDLLYATTLIQRLTQLTKAVDISYGAVDYIDGEGRFLRSWKPAVAGSLLPLYAAGYSPMLQQGTLIRRDLYHQLNGFSTDYRYVADADFWFRALESGAQFEYHGTSTVAAFRLHGAQITQMKKTEMHAEHRRMIAAHSQISTASSVWSHLSAWRLRNLGSYLERWHRAYRIGARKIICGSYDLP
jgi:glycosyltransferase involved in cell wall biosynthesis